MDQINGLIRWIKKNKFWLGCFLMSALMVGMWCFRVFMSIDAATADNVKKIKQKISTAENVCRVSADGVEGKAAHPNAKSEEGIRIEMGQTVDSIIAAWEKRVNDQRKILKWPSEIIESPKFASTFSQYDPPERIPDTWLQSSGKIGALLKLYGKNIPKQMVVLTGDDLLRTRWNYDPERLEAEKMAAVKATQPGNARRSFNFGGEDEDDVEEEESGGGRSSFGAPKRGGFNSTPEDTAGMIMDKATGEMIDLNQYAVLWSDTNQALWQTKMTSFKGRDDNQLATNTPTPLQCCMLQQDLWLLEAIFRIIREVNGDADANDISTIKRLDHVVFGRDVGGKLGELTPFDPRLGTIESVSDAGPGNMEFEEIEEDEFAGGGEFGAERTLSSPYEKRYVDLNFEPLEAERVKAIIESTDLPEEDLELMVSKRVPVRIAVRMKETEIARFMAACANSPFAFEIQQVRWNKHVPGEEIPLGGGNLLGNNGSRGSGRKGSSSPTLTSTPVEVRTNYDVNVEFYGIVKIYNPVRPKVLRAAAGLDEESVDPNDAASVSPSKRGQSKVSPERS